MYLLLVDYSVISSADLQEMIEQSPSGTDIVNCFSADTLLKVADKISPDIIIIDFDLVSDNLNQLFSSLRAKSKGAHIMTLINPENYERLFAAIELGGVDDYIVKPVRKEDFFARVQIAAKKPKLKGMGPYKPERSELGLADLPPLEIEALGVDLGDVSDFDLFTDRKELGESPEAISKELEAAKDTGVDPKEAIPFGQIYRNPYEEEHPELEATTESIAGEAFEPVEVFEKVEAITDDFESTPKEEESFDFFSSVDKPADSLTETAQFEEYSFDDITPSAGEEKNALVGEEFEAVQYEVEPAPGLFEEPSAEPSFESLADPFSSPEPEKPAGTGAIFEDDLFSAEPKPAAGSVESFEDILAGPPETEDKWDFPEPEPQERKATPLFQPVPSRNAGDEQYFDELFDEKPKPRLEQNEPELFQATDFPETALEPFFGETAPAGKSAFVAEPLVERKEPKRQSSLPGESADDFLFGPAEPEGAAYSRSRVDDSLFDDDEDDDEDEPPRRRKKSGSSGSGLAKTASVAGNVLFVVLLLFMATLSFYLIQSRISGGVPKVAGYQMYIVLSGSMSPEFDTGSIAFVKETLPDQLVVGDIITFRSQSGSDSLTTHRIVEVNRDEGLRFVTRGDANNVNDPNMVLAENVVGRVTGSIPYVGYVMSFVQTRQGLILLIFVPGVLIILFELGKIMKYLTQDEGGGRKSKKRKKYPRLAED